MHWTRRSFLQALSAAAALLLSRRAYAIGEHDRVAIPLLRYAGNWNPRPNALRRLLQSVEQRTSILVETASKALDPASPDLFSAPFVVLAGDRAFEPLPDAAILNLRQYLQAGGFLLVDSAEGVQDGPFMQSVRRDLARIYDASRVVVVPRDHVLYKSFFLLDKPVGRVVVSDNVEGVFDDDRLAVVISHNDLLGAWERDNFGSWTFDCTPGGETQREHATRVGINLVMYALCINYKADQVHIPFILRRRQWKVD